MHGELGGLRCRSARKGRIIFDYIAETVPTLLEISLNGVGIISDVECGCSKLKNTTTDLLAPKHLAGAQEHLILRSRIRPKYALKISVFWPYTLNYPVLEHCAAIAQLCHQIHE